MLSHALDWLLAHWLLLFFLGFFGWVGKTLKGMGSGIRSVFSAGHRRRVEELRLQVKLEKARNAGAPAVEPPKPGPCVHRQVVPVIPANEEAPVGWLCKCGERLPATWAVREEDL